MLGLRSPLGAALGERLARLREKYAGKYKRTNVKDEK